MAADGVVMQQRRTGDPALRGQDWSDYRERANAAGRTFLEAVDSILDTVRAGAARSEAEGRVPKQTVEAMIETGLFRALTPLQYGGLEMSPAAFFEGVMRIAAADSSAAWIAGQINIHAFEIALMDQRMQDEFWGTDPNARASSSYAPIGRWEQVDGGYVLRARGHSLAASTTPSGSFSEAAIATLLSR